MTTTARTALVTAGCLALIGMLMLPAACRREERRFDALRQSSGQTSSASVQSGGSSTPDRGGPFRQNAWGISEGKRLFTFYNCAGCHANGGGGMGPALMDDRWIYGADENTIHQTIADGRPNGMPAFRNRIPDAQIWMLVAYVQSMSGQAPIDVLPSRSDHMRYSTPENARRAQTPVQTHTP